MREISVSELTAHPQNPRFRRDDIVEDIARQLTANGFQEEHAILVRPFEGRYQIISGHHRFWACQSVGVETVPAWVKDLNDEDAYMQLALCNSQGEMSPLERGFHALNYASTAQGKDGEGLAAYAKNMGVSKQIISVMRGAANVAANLSTQVDKLQTKTKHLNEIHKLPESCWQEAVECMLKKEWSAKITASKVKAAKAGKTDKQTEAIFFGLTSVTELERIARMVSSVRDSFEHEIIKEYWDKWLEENPHIFDVKVWQKERIRLESEEQKLFDAEQELLDAEQLTKEEQRIALLPQLVLADPPWKYEHSKSDSRQIENQYPTADIDDIIGHKPETRKDCILVMWAVAPKIPEALEVMGGWGFEFVTSAVWDKEKIGMGYWFRGQHELLLIGRKGKMSPPDVEHRVSSVFREARGTHSKKPACVYEWVEKAFPELNKLEMYCREPREGWEVFGNESK